MKPSRQICVPLRWLLVVGILIVFVGLAILMTKEGFGGPAPTVLESRAIARVGIGMCCAGLAVVLGAVIALFVTERRRRSEP